MGHIISHPCLAFYKRSTKACLDYRHTLTSYNTYIQIHLTAHARRMNQKHDNDQRVEQEWLTVLLEFVCRWSMGSILFLASWAVLLGPVTYTHHLISGPRLPFTAAYFGTIALTLYFAIGVSSKPSLYFQTTSTNCTCSFDTHIHTYTPPPPSLQNPPHEIPSTNDLRT